MRFPQYGKKVFEEGVKMKETENNQNQALTKEENAREGVFLPNATEQHGGEQDASSFNALNSNESVSNAADSNATGERVSTKKKGERKRKTLSCILVAAIAFISFGGGVLTRQLSLDGEIRSLIKLKNRIQSSYYYEISDKDFYDAIFNAVSEGLLDEYSTYMDAEEYEKTHSQAKGEQSGLGLVFTTKAADGSDQMLITRVCGNSPAEEAGIEAGDYVVGFGSSAQELTQSNSFDEFVNFLSDYETGKPFVVCLKEQGMIELAKQAYVENYVFYRTEKSAYCFTGKNADVLTEKGKPFAFLGEETAYIRLTQFNGSAAEQFSQAMRLFQTQNKKHLLLDLRGNGGGYLDIMREIASYFCKTAEEETPVVAVADYGEYQKEYSATGNYYRQFFAENSRICVLADNQTASASECLIGCMYDYGTIGYDDICLAERSGEAKTFGKGIMQTTYSLGLAQGDAVKLTTARICWPKSLNCIHGRGVLPADGALRIAENPVENEEIKAAAQVLFS